MNYYLGIDIGGTKCAVVRGDETGTVTAKVRFATTTPKKDSIIPLDIKSGGICNEKQRKNIGNDRQSL